MKKLSGNSDSGDGKAKSLQNLKPWPKGVSGNPTGARKKNKQIEEIAQESAEAALKKLVSLMKSKDQNVALKAAQAVLDRGVGKPKQTIANEVTRKRDVTDIDDAELAAIAQSGSTGTSTPKDGTSESDIVH